jgi:outer membrane protein OmpA-like peptidoglycan-associated protein
MWRRLFFYNELEMKTMKNITIGTNKIALAVLALSLSQAANATDDFLEYDIDNTNTYWGVGLGSVLGAVIAGPPGAAIGATLGGSLGWGSDSHSALDQSQLRLDENEKTLELSITALHENEEALDASRSSLQQSRQKVAQLSRSNALQLARLTDMTEEKGGDESWLEGQERGSNKQRNTTLKALTEHYAQNVYFRNGESEVPDYAETGLSSLTDFLKSHPDLHVTLKGYTDHRGGPDFNKVLAQSRVDGIRNVLTSRGVDSKRISVEAVGDKDLLIQPGDASNYVLDRRVSIALSVAGQDAPAIASFAEVTP